MTNSEILKLAIEKAKVNGYINYNNFIDEEMIMSYEEISKIIIFSHDFAKAFWGEELLIVDEHYKAEIVKQNSKEEPYSLNSDYIQSWKLEFPKWQFHLREMVLEEEPLKYLEKFL